MSRSKQRHQFTQPHNTTDEGAFFVDASSGHVILALTEFIKKPTTTLQDTVRVSMNTATAIKLRDLLTQEIRKTTKLEQRRAKVTKELVEELSKPVPMSDTHKEFPSPALASGGTISGTHNMPDDWLLVDYKAAAEKQTELSPEELKGLPPGLTSQLSRKAQATAGSPELSKAFDSLLKDTRYEKNP